MARRGRKGCIQVQEKLSDMDKLDEETKNKLLNDSGVCNPEDLEEAEKDQILKVILESKPDYMKNQEQEERNSSEEKDDSKGMQNPCKWVDDLKVQSTLNDDTDNNVDDDEEATQPPEGMTSHADDESDSENEEGQQAGQDTVDSHSDEAEEDCDVKRKKTVQFSMVEASKSPEFNPVDTPVVSPLNLEASKNPAANSDGQDNCDDEDEETQAYDVQLAPETQGVEQTLADESSHHAIPESPTLESDEEDEKFLRDIRFERIDVECRPSVKGFNLKKLQDSLNPLWPSMCRADPILRVNAYKNKYSQVVGMMLNLCLRRAVREKTKWGQRPEQKHAEKDSVVSGKPVQMGTHVEDCLRVKKATAAVKGRRRKVEENDDEKGGDGCFGERVVTIVRRRGLRSRENTIEIDAINVEEDVEDPSKFSEKLDPYDINAEGDSDDDFLLTTRSDTKASKSDVNPRPSFIIGDGFQPQRKSALRSVVRSKQLQFDTGPTDGSDKDSDKEEEWLPGNRNTGVTKGKQKVAKGRGFTKQVDNSQVCKTTSVKSQKSQKMKSMSEDASKMEDVEVQAEKPGFHSEAKKRKLEQTYTKIQVKNDQKISRYFSEDDNNEDDPLDQDKYKFNSSDEDIDQGPHGNEKNTRTLRRRDKRENERDIICVTVSDDSSDTVKSIGRGSTPEVEDKQSVAASLSGKESVEKYGKVKSGQSSEIRNIKTSSIRDKIFHSSKEVQHIDIKEESTPINSKGLSLHCVSKHINNQGDGLNKNFSQESQADIGSCSQGSNSLLDEHGYIYSTQINPSTNRPGWCSKTSRVNNPSGLGNLHVEVSLKSSSVPKCEENKRKKASTQSSEKTHLKEIQEEEDPLEVLDSNTDCVRVDEEEAPILSVNKQENVTQRKKAVSNNGHPKKQQWSSKTGGIGDSQFEGNKTSSPSSDADVDFTEDSAPLTRKALSRKSHRLAHYESDPLPVKKRKLASKEIDASSTVTRLRDKPPAEAEEILREDNIDLTSDGDNLDRAGVSNDDNDGTQGNQQTRESEVHVNATGTEQNSLADDLNVEVDEQAMTLCPICNKDFPLIQIEAHASTCGEEEAGQRFEPDPQCLYCQEPVAQALLREHQRNCSGKDTHSPTALSRVTRSRRGEQGT